MTVLTINQYKQEIEQLIGCATTNYLKFQYAQLRELKANTRVFWQLAYGLALADHSPKPESEPTTLKITFSEREREAIAAVLNFDNFGNTKIQPQDILRAYILAGNFYRFVYLEGGIEKSQTLHKEQYLNYLAAIERTKAIATKEAEPTVNIVSEEEAELITQYSGIWVAADQVIEKTQSYQEGKIYYRVNVGYSDRPITIAMGIEYFESHLPEIELIDREKIIDGWLNNLPPQTKEVVNQMIAV